LVFAGSEGRDNAKKEGVQFGGFWGGRETGKKGKTRKATFQICTKNEIEKKAG